MIRILFACITAIVIVAVSGLLVAQRVNASIPTIPEEGAVFAVEPGESLNTIVQRLNDENLIRSSLFLKLISYAKGTQSSFQVGTYLVEPGMTGMQIHNLLVSGKELLIRVTLPEGYTAKQVAGRLEKAEITESALFLSAIENESLLKEYEIPASSAEGYLFPDTYLFPRNFPADRVADVLISRFFQRVGTLLGESELPDADKFHDIVVLASIIEREYRDPDEARLMASVFYNRLETQMRLQSCATVAYVLTEELGQDYPEVLTFDDLEIESDYNTYRSSGLPPGPIANPGLTALDAALFPADSDFLFFVLKDAEAGKHEFSRSFDEHLFAKSLYIKKS